MKRLCTSMLLLAAVCWSYADVNLQVFYDFGSENTACANQRSHRVTSTVEMFQPDKWGNTYFFVDIDYAINHNKTPQKDPRNCPFGAYWEIARCLNFWQNSSLKDLSLQIEYDGGLGIYGGHVVQGGYGINHAVLIGPNYALYTPDYKNTFTLQLLFKYIADEYNMWQFQDANGNHIKQSGNVVPLQFTFVWTCRDFCTLPGLTFSGFVDVWGQKQSVLNHRDNTYTDPSKQSFVICSEPQLWYCVGQHFGCPNLNIGTEIELSYNFTGAGFMCNPCLGLKWVF